MNERMRKWKTRMTLIASDEQLQYCLLITFLVGLAAHEYAFSNSIFSHDSLGAIYATVAEDDWKIALGRFGVPFYRKIVRGGISFPWLVGVLALLWIGIVGYVLARIFKLSSKLSIFLLCSVLVTNLTVTSLAATYMHELDVDMFALLAATLAAFVWRRWTWGIWPGMLLCAVALSIYQSYFSVTITIIMMVSMLSFLEGDPTEQVFLKGSRGIGMLIGGGVLYLVLLRVICAVTGVALVDNYNGLLSITKLSFADIGRLIFAAYQDWFTVFLQPSATYMGCLVKYANIVLHLLVCIIVMMVMVRKTISVTAKGLFLLLMILLPLGMNISFVLSGGMVHDLMRYAFWLFYFWGILLAQWALNTDEKSDLLNVSVSAAKALLLIAMIIIIWNNVLVSNGLYLKKDLEHQSTLSQMTRVLDRLEEIPDYVAGETPVVFVSQSSQAKLMPGFEELAEVTGAQWNTAISYNTPGMYDAYFRYILNTPILLDGAAWSSFQTDERITEMPVFPSQGSVKEIDGIVVVKMGD